MKITISPQYLAGVMDSDGSFSITERHVYRNNSNFTCMVQLTWSFSKETEQFMKTLIDKFGGSYFCGFPTGKKLFPNTKRVIKYCATGTAAENLVTFVIPHLILKRKQAKNILYVRELVKSFKGSRPIGITKKLKILFDGNKILNSKNGSK